MDILSFQFLFRKYHLSEIVVRKDEIIVPKYYENKKYSWVPKNKKYSSCGNKKFSWFSKMQNIQRSSRHLRCAHIHYFKMEINWKYFIYSNFEKKLIQIYFLIALGWNELFFFVMVACFEFENNKIVLRINMNKKWINKNHSTINFWQMSSFFSHITFNTYCQLHDKRYIFFLSCAISFYNTKFGFAKNFQS